MTVKELQALLASIPEELQGLEIGVVDIEQGLCTDFDWHIEQHDNLRWIELEARLA